VGKPAPDSDQVRVIYPEEDSHRFNVGFERPGPGSWTRLAATLAWDSYRLILDKDRVATPTQPRSVVRSDVDANDYELRFEAERPLGPARLVIGANAYGRYDLHTVDTTSSFDPAGELAGAVTDVGVERARRDDVGVFAGVDRELGLWGVAAGLRIDRVSSENRGGFFGDLDSSNSDLSGFLSLARDLGSGVELTAQVARGFRDPLLSDRYYRGHTGRGFVTGNPTLESETSLQYDLAIRRRSPRFDLAVYGFLYRVDDLIERFRDGDDFFFRNRGRAEITGVEVEADIDLAERLSLLLGGHYLRGEVRDDGTPTDDVPAPGAYLMLRGESGSRWWWMVRAAANLLDSAYLGSADEDAVLAPGRSIQLGLRGRL
jgi:outer membrane receptor protein involved in Fe transport